MKKNNLQVVRYDGGNTVIANRDFSPGEKVYRISQSTGISRKRTKFSVQMPVTTYLVEIALIFLMSSILFISVVPVILSMVTYVLSYVWKYVHIDEPVLRYLNHSFCPNVGFRGISLYAIRPIRKGDEIRFNYYTTESRISSPFVDEDKKIEIK